ncbi:MAG: amidohydrolase [Oscillospiraceae bacterium]|nr:amidohydrolase [Oscillospiraceae bacterium]
MKKSFVTDLALKLAPYAVEIRHRIHRNPETAMVEYKTTELIKHELLQMGVELQDIGLKTGCVGLIRGLKPGEGKVLGIRADIDALPMQDLCGKPWHSTVDGVAHTCGHDSHTAALLAAAKGLMQIRDQFSGIVKLVFQPGEEGMLGAKVLVEKGVMDDPTVDMMVAMHNTPMYKLGQIACAEGQIMAASDRFLLKFVGKSAHGSRPSEGRNSLLALSHAVLGLHEIISNEVNTREMAVVNTCIAEGGTACNIVPAEASLKGTVRTLSPDVRKTVEAAIRRVAEHAAAMCGCTAEISYSYGCPPVTNDAELTELVRKAAEKIVDDGNYLHLDSLLGGEDFSVYSQVNPKTCLYRLGVARESVEREPQLHNAHFDFNDDAMPYAIAGHLQLVLDING